MNRTWTKRDPYAPRQYNIMDSFNTTYTYFSSYFWLPKPGRNKFKGLGVRDPLSSFFFFLVCFNIENCSFENRWFYTAHSQQNAPSHLYKGVCLYKLPSWRVSSHCFPLYRHPCITAPPPPAQPWTPHSWWQQDAKFNLHLVIQTRPEVEATGSFL